VAVRLVLIADPDRVVGRKLMLVAQTAGAVAEVSTTAEDARRALQKSQPALFFSNLRLGAMRGVGLVQMARMAHRSVRAILYGRGEEASLVREALNAGALFEPYAFLPQALRQYVKCTLPASDRRDPARFDRRRIFRGGRRATDIEALHRPRPDVETRVT
jgi:DNA-binding NtrC family response regulator